MGNENSGRWGPNHRPTQWSQELQDRLFEYMEEGLSFDKIQSIYKDMPTDSTIYRWSVGKNSAPPEFIIEYEEARRTQASAFARQISTIADGLDVRTELAKQHEVAKLPDDATDAERRRVEFAATTRSVHAAKMQIDARKWTASRMHPNRWGDQVKVEHSNNPDNPVPGVSVFTNMSDEQLAKLEALQVELEDDGSE